MKPETEIIADSIKSDNDKQEFLTAQTFSDKIDERSELVQEIISNKPGFLERSALFICLGILLLMFVTSWFVKYPDIIQANAILIAKNSPKEIITQQDGHLVRLFVHNNQQVNKSQMIGWLESTANHKEIIELSNQIDSSIILLNLNKIDKLLDLINRHYNNLGEIQQPYQQFITAWQQFNDYMINGYYSNKRRLLENDIAALQGTWKTIKSQKELTVQDINLAKESFEMNKKLYDEKVLTKEEYRIQTSKYVNKQMAVPQLDASLLTNETQTRGKVKEIEQLNHDLAQQKVIFEQTLQSLKSQVDDWMKKYVLRSPINGRVSFIIPIQENQYLPAGKLLGYINPSDNHFYAEANLSQVNFGKVDTGMIVQLRFDAYPYQEIGFVEGRLDYISSVPSDSGFLSTIKLKNGLMTNNHKLIPYKSGLKAQAMIITKTMRLTDRLYYNMVKSTSAGNK